MSNGWLTLVAIGPDPHDWDVEAMASMPPPPPSPSSAARSAEPPVRLRLPSVLGAPTGLSGV